MRFTRSVTPALCRGSVVRMKSSNETSSRRHAVRNTSSIRSQYASGSSPSSLAFLNTFCECSSFPIRNSVSKPQSRLYRAMTSAQIFSYDVPRCGWLFT